MLLLLIAVDILAVVVIDDRAEQEHLMLNHAVLAICARSDN